MTDRLSVEEMRSLISAYSPDDIGRIVDGFGPSKGIVVARLPADPSSTISWDIITSQTELRLQNISGLSFAAIPFLVLEDFRFAAFLWKSIIRRAMSGERVSPVKIAIAKMLRAHEVDGPLIDKLISDYPEAHHYDISEYVQMYHEICVEQGTYAPDVDFPHDVINFERPDGQRILETVKRTSAEAEGD